MNDIPGRDWDNNVKGFQLDFTSKKTCEYKNEPWKLTITAYCNRNVSDYLDENKEKP